MISAEGMRIIEVGNYVVKTVYDFILELLEKGNKNLICFITRDKVRQFRSVYFFGQDLSSHAAILNFDQFYI